MPEQGAEAFLFDPHMYEHKCTKNRWCKIHGVHVYYKGEMKFKPFPWAFNFLTSEQGWVRVEVYCGPGAYLPKWDAHLAAQSGQAGFYKPPF